MRTVLHLMNFINSGGAERYIISLVRGLSNRGYTFYVGVSRRTNNSFERELLSLGAKIVLIPIDSVLDFRAAFKISRFCKENNIDIVHTHFLRENCVSVIAKALGNRARVINTCHMNWRNRVSVRVLNRILTKFDDKVIAVSEAVKDNLVREGIDSDKIDVIYNGVDCDYWGEDIRSTIDDEFNIGDGVFKVVTIARFNEEKGYFYLLDIIRGVINKVEAGRVKFILVGDGEKRSEVERNVVDKGIEDAVIFAGVRNDVRNILRGADLYVSPSKNEALGISILEAMACGVLVVATNVGGTPEILGCDSEFLVEYGDVEDAVNKILKIYKSYDSIVKGVVTDGREKIRKKFSLEGMLQKTYNLQQ